MHEKMRILSGYDNRGIVYDSDDFILRSINSAYAQQAREIYNRYKELNLEQSGIVETQLTAQESSGEIVLRHKKHVISYPYEWTVNMFKDAALLHLSLFSELDKAGLALKDALSNNIVFDFTKPVFVDFFSLIKKEELSKEKWLNAGNYADARFAVFDRMFTPYIFIPFMAMNNKDYRLARKLLSERACNCGRREPTWSDVRYGFLFNLKPFVRNKIKNIIENKKETSRIKEIKSLLSLKAKLPFLEFNKAIFEFIKDTDVTPPQSGYATYYEDKKEELNFENQTGWTAKQENIYAIIKELMPKRVLDLGANTGWFSMLAEKEGAEVIATDIDESSVDLLYLKAKEKGLKILPLLLPFDDLEKKIYGVSYNEKEYEGRDFKSIPLFLPATERLKSDMVMCLGLLHHLILGMGKDIDAIFKILSKLTEKMLILEFVSLNDNLIQEEPSFFKNINKYSEHNYNTDIVRNAGLKYFKSAKVMDSSPETRKLLIFNVF